MSADHDDEILSLRRRMHDLSDVVQAQATRGAVMANDIRTLVTMVRELKDDHKAFTSETGVELRAIRDETTKTNGTLIRHEERLTGHDREIRDLKRDGKTSGGHDLRRASDRKDAMTFTISRNTVISAAIFLGSFVAAMMAAFMGWKLPLP